MVFVWSVILSVTKWPFNVQYFAKEQYCKSTYMFFISDVDTCIYQKNHFNSKIVFNIVFSAICGNKLLLKLEIFSWLCLVTCRMNNLCLQNSRHLLMDFNLRAEISPLFPSCLTSQQEGKGDFCLQDNYTIYSRAPVDIAFLFQTVSLIFASNLVARFSLLSLFRQQRGRPRRESLVGWSLLCFGDEFKVMWSRDVDFDDHI